MLEAKHTVSKIIELFMFEIFACMPSLIKISNNL